MKNTNNLIPPKLADKRSFVTLNILFYSLSFLITVQTNSFIILINIFFSFLTGVSSKITPLVNPFSNSFSNCQFTITVLG